MTKNVSIGILGILGIIIIFLSGMAIALLTTSSQEIPIPTLIVVSEQEPVPAQEQPAIAVEAEGDEVGLSPLTSDEITSNNSSEAKVSGEDSAPPVTELEVSEENTPPDLTIPQTSTPLPTSTSSTALSEPVTIPLEEPAIPNTILITFKPNTSPEQQAAYIESIGGTVNQTIGPLNTISVEVPPSVAAQTLPASDVVTVSEPDYYVTALVEPLNDPLFPQQWALPAIHAPEAWATLPENTPSILVAVVDSGICGTNLDLAGRIDSNGWDWVDNDADPTDSFGHGCAISGVIAANGNDGIGLAGVAPTARILPLRVLNGNGVGSYSNVAAAIVYAVDHGAQVINLSLGGPNPSSVLENAIQYATSHGVTVVAAAGNTGTEGVLYPARYAAVIAVGSVDQNLQRSNFSTTGPEVDSLAPGRDIVVLGLDGNPQTVSGTSFATPHVTGVVVLAKSLGINPLLDGGVINTGLEATSSPTPIVMGTADVSEATPTPTDQPIGVPEGYILIQGDILVPANFFDPSAQALYETYVWTNGKIPYAFDVGVTTPNRDRAIAAMTELEQIGGIDFVLRSTEANYIKFYNSTQGNWAYVGQIGGMQEVFIQNWDTHYVIVHELLHALGFWHEQSRSDRNNFIHVNTQNIIPGQAYNFDIIPAAQIYGAYDFDSIMHYYQYAFSICPDVCTTIDVLSPNEAWQDEIGQLDNLSDLDKEGVLYLYTPGYGSNPTVGSTITLNTAWKATTGNSASVVINETKWVGLMVNSATFSGPDAAKFSFSTTFTPFTINNGGLAVTRTLKCNTSVAGTFTATLTVAHNGESGPATYPLVCNVKAPGYSSNPTLGNALTINTYTGDSAANRTTLTISETGQLKLTLTSGTFTGTHATKFSLNPTLSNVSIEDGAANISRQVVCNTSVAGTFTATLTIAHNAPGSPATYPVTCVVVAASGFGSVPAIGSTLTINTIKGATTGNTSVLQLKETGTQALTISNLSLSGADAAKFSITPTTLPIAIANGGVAVNRTIVCNTSTGGTFTATLTVTHNDPLGTSTYNLVCNVAVPGYGSNPAAGSTITINTAWKATSGNTAPVVISETSTAPLTVSSATFSGSDAAKFSFTTTFTSFTINNGGLAMTRTVKCNTSTPGTFTATLTINHNGNGSPATYPLVCNVNAAGYSSIPVSGSTLTINTYTGDSTTNRTALTLNETGNLALKVTSATFSGTHGTKFSLNSTLNNVSIADGAAGISRQVVCNTSVAGTFTATLTIVHNAPGTPATYSLTCVVVAAPGFGSTPAVGTTLTINAKRGASTGNTSVLQLKETGTQSLSISNLSLSGPDAAKFSITPATVPIIIVNGGAMVNRTIVCNTSVAGNFTATLTVTHNDPLGSSSYPLVCNVTAPGYGSNPAPGSTITINTVKGATTGNTSPLVISETGTSALTINSTTFSGTHAVKFTFTTSVATFTIADTGLPITRTIRCNTSVAGTFNATLTVAHNAPGSPATYTLTCVVAP